MKFFIFIALFLTPLVNFSQERSREQQIEYERRSRAEQGLDPIEVDTTTSTKITPEWSRESQTEEYVLLVASAKFLSTKVQISLDYGQARKLFTDSRVKDSTGNVIQFNSVIDALNYMNSLGWEFVNAYTITVGNQNVYHYLMRRKIIKE